MIPLLLALWLGPQDKPPEKCALSGTVVDAVTGEALAKVEITLQRVPGSNAVSTVSMERGRFAMVDLEPGDYRLKGDRSGYIETAYGARKAESAGALLHLEAGQSLVDLSLKLIPGGVISGTVRDADGEPLEGAFVTLANRNYEAGGVRIEGIDSADTDDLGQYRFRKLPPGKYFLSADTRSKPGNMTDHSPPTAGPHYASVATLYPGVAELAAAMPVEVTAGARVLGIDIKLLRRPLFRVSGQVISAGAYELALLPFGETELARALTTSVGDNRQDFMFDQVPSGSYTLQTRGGVSGSMPIEVGGKDVEGIRLIVGGGGAIMGRISVEGEGKFAPIGSVFMTTDGRRGERPRINEDLGFYHENLAPGRYKLQIFSAQQMSHFYVKTTRVNGVDQSSEKVDVAAGAATAVEIVLGSDGARVSGTVHTKDGDLASSGTVVLIPDGALHTRTDLYRVTSTDQFGSFQMDNVAPGAYKAFAWDEIETGQWFDPDFISQYSKFAMAWEVKPNGRSILGLQLTSTGAR